VVQSLRRLPMWTPAASERRSGTSDRRRLMEDDTERADLARRISEAGWHILRDEQVEDGYVVEFQQGDYTEYHPGAETRSTTGQDRKDAYRRFLEEMAPENPASGT
jgi:hypothetical protein